MLARAQRPDAVALCAPLGLGRSCGPGQRFRLAYQFSQGTTAARCG